MRDTRPIISLFTQKRPSRATIGDRHRRLLDRLSAAGAPPIRRFLERISHDAIKKIKSTSVDVDAIFKPAQYRAGFARVMLPVWRRGCVNGVEFEARWIDRPDDDDKTRQRFTVEDIESGEAIRVEIPDAVMKEIVAWVNQREVGLWNTIGKTTRNRLSKAIADGLKDGDTLNDLTKRVESVMKRYSKYQAKRVARTETTGAMNAGQQFERDELDIEWKSWVATKDIRTRGSDPSDEFNHLVADGQIVENHSPFIVSGQRLLYPGDTSLGATAGNIVHCRCAAVAEFEPPKRQRRPRASAAA